jgi:hypothetical protein
VGHRNRTLRSLSALRVPDTDERFIAAAASIGLSRSPNRGKSTPAATGTASVLEANAHARFWRMFRTVARPRRRAHKR